MQVAAVTSGVRQKWNSRVLVSALVNVIWLPKECISLVKIQSVCLDSSSRLHNTRISVYLNYMHLWMLALFACTLGKGSQWLLVISFILANSDVFFAFDSSRYIPVLSLIILTDRLDIWLVELARYVELKPRAAMNSEMIHIK